MVKNKTKEQEKKQEKEAKLDKQLQLDKAEQINTSEQEKIVQKEIFADPTYDATFKMLFGSEKNKDILISLINSLLDFKDDREVIDVEINSSDLMTEGVLDVQGSVDVLCTTKTHQKIAVEMQRKYKDYFLPRSQEYMSKLIMGQVKEGQGGEYDKAIMDTYIISIGKQNIFRGKYQLSDKSIFEVTVLPWVVETQQEVPGNKMHWKFFELPKFIQQHKNNVVTKENSLKEQWLDFLVKCGTQKEIPESIEDIIKKGYEIMKMANWTEDQRTLYWKQKVNEIDELKEQERIQEEIREQAFEKGKIEGKIKGEINTVKALLENAVEAEKIATKLKFLKPSSIDFINEHMEDAASQLYQDYYQDLVGDVNINFE